MMLPKNPNQMTLVPETTQELTRLYHEIALDFHRLRTERGLFAVDIAILSGSVITAKKLERIELERIEHMALSEIISLALILKHRVKLSFEPIREG